MGVVLLVLLAAALSGQGIKNMHYYLQMKTSKHVQMILYSVQICALIRRNFN